jgi:hypothetical protein
MPPQGSTPGLLGNPRRQGPNRDAALGWAGTIRFEVTPSGPAQNRWHKAKDAHRRLNLDTAAKIDQGHANQQLNELDKALGAMPGRVHNRGHEAHGCQKDPRRLEGEASSGVPRTGTTYARPPTRVRNRLDEHRLNLALATSNGMIEKKGLIQMGREPTQHAEEAHSEVGAGRGGIAHTK